MPSSHEGTERGLNEMASHLRVQIDQIEQALLIFSRVAEQLEWLTGQPKPHDPDPRPN